jgi:ankyrin repeat protein
MFLSAQFVMQMDQPDSSPPKQVARSAHSQHADNHRKRILRSIINDDASAVSRWLDKNSALLPDDPLNNSVMHMVAFKGRLSTLRMMWARGMKCDHRNLQGETALHWAVKCSDETAMRAVLLELITIGDADVNAVTTNGDTPLMYAIADGNLAAAMELCKRGASLLLLNKDGDGPIHLAISSGNAGVVAYVLERQPGAAQVRDGLGRLPIQIALESGSEDMIKLVLLAWPLCLGCRTVEGVLMHDVFPQLGLMHLLEGLGFEGECVWQMVIGTANEAQPVSVDVSISGTAFYLTLCEIRSRRSLEVRLNDMNWDFDNQNLTAVFLNAKGDRVMTLTANSLATHKKLQRQLQLALEAVSPCTSAERDIIKSCKVLSLKKSEVPDSYHCSDSASVDSGRMHREASANDLSWLQQLDDHDVELMIKWGVVSVENIKALSSKRRPPVNEGDIIINQSTAKNQIPPNSNLSESSVAVIPAAPPPRRISKGAIASASAAVSSVPLAPPRRGAQRKSSTVAQKQTSDSVSETASPCALAQPSQSSPVDDLYDNDMEPPPPPPIINYSKKCSDTEAAKVAELQFAFESGSLQSSIIPPHQQLLFPFLTPIQLNA